MRWRSGRVVGHQAGQRAWERGCTSYCRRMHSTAGLEMDGWVPKMLRGRRWWWWEARSRSRSQAWPEGDWQRRHDASRRWRHRRRERRIATVRTAGCSAGGSRRQQSELVGRRTGVRGGQGGRPVRQGATKNFRSDVDNANSDDGTTSTRLKARLITFRLCWRPSALHQQRQAK